MRNKLIIVTAIVSLVLVALTLQMRSSDRVADLESRPMLDEAQLALLGQAEWISLARADQVVELRRDQNGWGVPVHDQFPVLRERLAALLTALRGARILEAKTANPEHHARLGLDDQASGDNSLKVVLGAGDNQLGLIFGEAAGSGQLMRFAGQDQVWLLSRPLGMSLSSHDWLDLKVVELPMELAASARWAHADGDVLALEKASEGDYNFRIAGLAPEQQQGNERWINSMVLALLDLRAQSVALRDSLELDQPKLRMTVTTWAGTELQAALYELAGRYWVVIESFAQEPSESEQIRVNADSRWAFQIGIGQMENLNKRQADIIRTAVDE